MYMSNRIVTNKKCGICHVVINDDDAYSCKYNTRKGVESDIRCMVCVPFSSLSSSQLRQGTWYCGEIASIQYNSFFCGSREHPKLFIRTKRIKSTKSTKNTPYNLDAKESICSL